jgi:hypothetical protein
MPNEEVSLRNKVIETVNNEKKNEIDRKDCWSFVLS